MQKYLTDNDAEVLVNLANVIFVRFTELDSGWIRPDVYFGHGEFVALKAQPNRQAAQRYAENGEAKECHIAR